MKVQTVTFFTSSLSGIVLIICLFAMWHIHTNVKSIWAELDNEMDEFKVFTNILWRDIRNLSDNKKAVRARAKRGDQYETSGIVDTPNFHIVNGNQVRTFPPTFSGKGAPPGTIGVPPDFCKCRSGVENKCRPGIPGPKGNPGSPGKDGFDGIPGIPGIDAMDYNPEIERRKLCFNCQQGPIGPPGSDGKRGPRGRKGADGRPGMQGHNGQPGSPGEPGPPGPIGPLGRDGPPGEKGDDGRKPIGRPGPKGHVGPPGPEGPAGYHGRDGDSGTIGPIGEPGGKGPAGPVGDRGSPGEEGREGRPGSDAHYCQCPIRGHGQYGIQGHEQQRLYNFLQ